MHAISRCHFIGTYCTAGEQIDVYGAVIHENVCRIGCSVGCGASMLTASIHEVLAMLWHDTAVEWIALCCLSEIRSLMITNAEDDVSMNRIRRCTLDTDCSLQLPATGATQESHLIFHLFVINVQLLDGRLDEGLVG